MRPRIPSIASLHSVASLRTAALAGGLLAALVASNQGESGVNDRVTFTPLDCGNPLLGCSFDHGLGLWADAHVQIEGQDGFSTAGLDLHSGDDGVLLVQKIADEGGRPTWSLHGAGEGTARLSAVDGDGNEADALDVAVRPATRLTLAKVLGNAVGPTIESGVETWTVSANQPVSLQARMLAADATELMGRIEYSIVVPVGSRILDSELAGSDATQGYLYVQPPAGVYPFSFELAVAPAVKVDAAIKAQ
jgi:hypothetical protein